jgi:hypothetical protein
MNIREELLSDQTQSKALALRVRDFACASEENFGMLMECFVASDYTLAKRAAWSVRWAAESRPELIYPYINLLVGQLNRGEVHDAVIRNSLKILENVIIPEEFHGEVMDACFGFIQDRKSPIAVKAFSLSILFNLSKIYPEIRNELGIIIEENMEFETAAYRSRGAKILAFFKRTGNQKGRSK